MEQSIIELPSDLTIAHLDNFKSEVIQIVDTSDNIIIEDKPLAKIDTVGVQFLLSIINFIIAQKKSLQWQANSSILQESVKQLGLENSDFKQFLFK